MFYFNRIASNNLWSNDCNGIIWYVIALFFLLTFNQVSRGRISDWSIKVQGLTQGKKKLRCHITGKSFEYPVWSTSLFCRLVPSAGLTPSWDWIPRLVPVLGGSSRFSSLRSSWLEDELPEATRYLNVWRLCAIAVPVWWALGDVGVEGESSWGSASHSARELGRVLCIFLEWGRLTSPTFPALFPLFPEAA